VSIEIYIPFYAAGGGGAYALLPSSRGSWRARGSKEWDLGSFGRISWIFVVQTGGGIGQRDLEISNDATTVEGNYTRGSTVDMT